MHQLFFVKRAITVYVQRDDTEEYENVPMGSDCSVDCVGRSVQSAKEYLAGRTIDLSRSSYWHPDFTSFPVIDSIACVPAAATVWYIQLTVGVEKTVDVSVLTAIHESVYASLERSLGTAGRSDIASWKFKYVAIEPSLEAATRLTLTTTKGAKKQKLDGNTVGVDTFSKGYLGKY